MIYVFMRGCGSATARTAGAYVWMGFVVSRTRDTLLVHPIKCTRNKRVIWYLFLVRVLGRGRVVCVSRVVSCDDDDDDGVWSAETARVLRTIACVICATFVESVGGALTGAELYRFALRGKSSNDDAAASSSTILQQCACASRALRSDEYYFTAYAAAFLHAQQRSRILL